jgi:hypothetical protein
MRSSQWVHKITGTFYLDSQLFQASSILRNIKAMKLLLAFRPSGSLPYADQDLVFFLIAKCRLVGLSTRIRAGCFVELSE